MNITISKALKVKNRIAENIRKTDTKIETNNSIRADIGTEIDVLILFEHRKNLTNQLVEIKTAIAKSNFEIQDKIFRMSEIKGLISFLTGLNTTNGKVENRTFHRKESDPDVYEYRAAINANEVEKLVTEFQNELDTLQDEIEAFNATHKIELSF
jgi:hypothetical protein